MSEVVGISIYVDNCSLLGLLSTMALHAETSPKRKSRKRNITWYNPPFSKNVTTNVGQTFLKILDEEFPAGHILHKIFNRNTVNISYSCMSNFKQNIDGHNKSKLFHRAKTQTKKSAIAKNQVNALCRKIGWQNLLSTKPQ
jgi:hypothetical protein